ATAAYTLSLHDALPIFTIADVMLTMRPNRRVRMPGTSARISSTAGSMFCSNTAMYASWSQSSNLPGVGPALLVTRMSASGQAARSEEHTSELQSPDHLV